MHLVDDDRRRRAGLVEELVDGQPQNYPIDGVHALEPPVLRGLGDGQIDVAHGRDDAVRQRVQPERLQNIRHRRPPDLPLVEHLHGRRARTVPRLEPLARRRPTCRACRH